MADSNLQRWVGDQLIQLVGMQDKVIVQFLIELATSSATADALLQKLLDTDSLPNNDQARRFAQELFQVRSDSGECRLTRTGMWILQLSRTSAEDAQEKQRCLRAEEEGTGRGGGCKECREEKRFVQIDSRR